MNQNEHARHKRLWGIFFIAIATYIILDQFEIIDAAFSVGRIVICFLFVAAFIEGLAHKSIWGTLIPLAFLAFLIINPVFHLQINLWTILLAAVFLCIGLSIIFPHKHTDSTGEEWESRHHVDTEETINDQFVCCNRFGSSTKYINTGDFKGANISNSFGELKVYFDSATIITSPVTIEVQNSFGELQLFIPKEWAIKQNIRVTLGDCKVNNHNLGNTEPMVHLIGEVSLGEIQITYV